MTEPVIRQARPEDVDAIVEIALRAWEPIFTERREVLGEDITAWDRGDVRKQKAKGIRGHCERDLGTVYVTEVDGKIAGFITFAPIFAKGCLDIGNNAIDPEYQGRGLGQAQYRFVLDLARGVGLKYARVTTGLDDCHAAARAAYEKIGFGRGIPSITYYLEL